MTTFLEYGFLELPFLEDPFLTAVRAGSDGMQATMVIEDDQAVGMQSLMNIQDLPGANGMQSQAIVGDQDANGFEMFATKQQHIQHPKFLIDDFLTTEFLMARNCVILGMQANMIIEEEDANGMQANMIIDAEDPNGMQATMVIDDEDANGMQVLAQASSALGMQTNVSIYNTTNLRILCEFPSRGTTGINWTASSTATGDYGANNLNTDIVEQAWRSAGTGSVIVTCDTQITQGVAVDTLGLLNHNLSNGAIVNFAQSNDPTFASIPFQTNLQILEDNMFWISPDLPLAQYRYQRFTIQDNDNPDGFYQIGTIVFGSSEIFQDECFTQQITFGFKDFNDEVVTEGFTNVSNSRALKKILGLRFRSLDSRKGNFSILRDLITTYRTTHKCLWIPTPSATNQTITSKFALFSKLTQIPTETHNSADNNLDYISLDINLDESK